MQLLSGLADLTAAAVLAEATELRRLDRQAGATKLIRAAEWADLHPARDQDETAWEEWSPSPSLPRVSWDAPAEFAAALGLSTDAGRDLIQDALELRHRLTRVWRRVLAGEVDGWRARRIAQATLHQPDDVAAAVDLVVAPIAHKVGLITLDRLLKEALIRLHPDRVAAESAERLDRRHVTVHEEMSHGGVMRMEIRADLKDVLDFDDTVAAVAAVLANDPDCPESLDIRRAMAIGILADPEQAAHLLNHGGTHPATPDPHQTDGSADDPAGDPDTNPTGDPAAGPAGDLAARKPRSPRRPRRPRKQILLHFHISDQAVAGASPVGRMEHADRVVLADLIRTWCGRTDTHLTVLPVLDLADHIATDAYEAPDRLHKQTELTHPTCLFPWCTRPARRCDKDHAIAHADGGRTCSCNLIPLCRRHHRLKTHTRWRYHLLEPGVAIWRAPHGRQYLRDPSGTTDLGPAPDTTTTGDRSPPWTGCLYQEAS